MEDANAVLSRAHMLRGGLAGVGVARGPKSGADLRAARGRPPIGGRPFYSLMLLSAVARFMAGWFLFPRLREVRSVPATKDRELLFGVIGLKSAGA